MKTFPDHWEPPPDGVDRGRVVDIDEVVIDRLIAGIPVRSNVPERKAAVQILTLRGWSAMRIGQQLGCAQRTVVRYRVAMPIGMRGH
ncbi:hypothetical protein ABLG96_03810 [Nakamurella sp. A5-74]|uniref:Helix-turn-helix domain-containing protein n=1 Tax=Nakamurella sp. A5-74 TaxID=3158264 RepID=A0AAU8DT59_9ACTN